MFDKILIWEHEATMDQNMGDQLLFDTYLAFDGALRLVSQAINWQDKAEVRTEMKSVLQFPWPWKLGMMFLRKGGFEISRSWVFA